MLQQGEELVSGTVLLYLSSIGNGVVVDLLVRITAVCHYGRIGW